MIHINNRVVEPILNILVQELYVALEWEDVVVDHQEDLYTKAVMDVKYLGQFHKHLVDVEIVVYQVAIVVVVMDIQLISAALVVLMDVGLPLVVVVVVVQVDVVPVDILCMAVIQAIGLVAVVHMEMVQWVDMAQDVVVVVVMVPEAVDMVA